MTSIILWSSTHIYLNKGSAYRTHEQTAVGLTSTIFRSQTVLAKTCPAETPTLTSHGLRMLTYFARFYRCAYHAFTVRFLPHSSHHNMFSSVIDPWRLRHRVRSPTQTCPPQEEHHPWSQEPNLLSPKKKTSHTLLLGMGGEDRGAIKRPNNLHPNKNVDLFSRCASAAQI